MQRGRGEGVVVLSELLFCVHAGVWVTLARVIPLFHAVIGFRADL